MTGREKKLDGCYEMKLIFKVSTFMFVQWSNKNFKIFIL